MANYNEERPFVKSEDRDMRGNIIDSTDLLSTGVSDSRHQHDVIRASVHMSVTTMENVLHTRVI